LGAHRQCFAWSPTPLYHDLVAIGLTNGKTLLLRMEQNSEGSDVLASPLITLEPRHSRSCNVVSFSPQQPNLLASGLDKVRNDYCTRAMNRAFAYAIGRPVDLGH
jgi:hypothetical protein